MKNKWKGINNFLIIACLVIVVAGIVLRQLIDGDLWLKLMAIISAARIADGETPVMVQNAAKATMVSARRSFFK